MSGAYNKFAWFYDRLQKDVPYSDMAKLFDKLIKKYSSEKEVVLDLACGTGSLSMEMAKLGYDVIGVDLSQDMLNEALDKNFESGLNIRYLCQNMTKLELYAAADAVVCTLDSLNHLPNFEDVEKTIEKVSEYTYKGGVFIFDINTLYKHRNILENNAFNFDLEDLFCAWQNEINEDDSVNIYLDFFEKENNGKYSRYSENFTEHYFDPKDIEEVLEKNNFQVIEKYDGYSENNVTEDTQRILYVCKKL